MGKINYRQPRDTRYTNTTGTYGRQGRSETRANSADDTLRAAGEIPYQERKEPDFLEKPLTAVDAGILAILQVLHIIKPSKQKKESR